jgi:hypothetical protein
MKFVEEGGRRGRGDALTRETLSWSREKAMTFTSISEARFSAVFNGSKESVPLPIPRSACVAFPSQDFLPTVTARSMQWSKAQSSENLVY